MAQERTSPFTRRRHRALGAFSTCSSRGASMAGRHFRARLKRLGVPGVNAPGPTAGRRARGACARARLCAQSRSRMSAPPGPTHPLWWDHATLSAAPFEGELDADVAIIGAGISGLTLAYTLAEQ